MKIKPIHLLSYVSLSILFTGVVSAQPIMAQADEGKDIVKDSQQILDDGTSVSGDGDDKMLEDWVHDTVYISPKDQKGLEDTTKILDE